MITNIFQYATMVALIWKKNGAHLERVSNVKFFLNKHNWEGIKYPLEKNEKSFTKNSLP